VTGGWRQGKGPSAHPPERADETLGYYVRETTKQINLMDAIRKPVADAGAANSRNWRPYSGTKDASRSGADADITVFDPATVIDKSTYQQPALPSAGFRQVLVNGRAGNCGWGL